MSATFYKYGDWARAGTFLADLAPRSKKLSEEALRLQADKFKDKLEAHIDNQDIRWIPLTEDTVRQKKESNVAQMAWYETGTLRNNVEIRKIKSPEADVVIFVGFSPWRKHEYAGISMSHLANIIEYGWGAIPPRPLIRPTFDEVESEMYADVVKLGNDIVNGD